MTENTQNTTEYMNEKRAALVAWENVLIATQLSKAKHDKPTL